MHSPSPERLNRAEGHTQSSLASALARSVGSGASGAQIADALAAIWQEIDEALSPVIGKGGMAALYARTIHLTSASHPWLEGAVNGDLQAIESAPLRAAIAAQDRDKAAAGGSATLESFHALLDSMIGHSLSERFLSPLWARFPTPKQGGPP